MGFVDPLDPSLSALDFSRTVPKSFTNDLAAVSHRTAAIQVHEPGFPFFHNLRRPQLLQILKT
jgi:hypothetical protein